MTTQEIPTFTFRYEYLENVEPGSRGGGTLAIFERFGEEGIYQPGDRMRVAYFGTIESDGPVGAAWAAFMLHNRDDRPTGAYVRSMSNGDVVRVWTGVGATGETDVYLALEDEGGFVPVERPTSVTLHPERIAEEVTS